MRYRHAAPEDIATLAALRLQMLSESGQLAEGLSERIASNTRDFLRKGMASGECVCHVAEQAGEIVGMCCLNFFSLPPNDWCPDGKSAYLGNMYTLPPHRGCGVASRLLDMALEEARARGCERVLLHATDMGRPLYESKGFTSSPTAMAFYPPGFGP